MNNQSLSIEAKILAASSPIPAESKDFVYVNNDQGVWINKHEESIWKGEIPLDEYPINNDPDPEILIKENTDVIEYVQQIAIRYLRPPTPEPSGEIIINELAIPTEPAPPIIIRQQPERVKTPEPIIIRETPPTPPPQVRRQVITIPGKLLPPPPRKVIIERLPVLPDKPQPIIVERWLAYPKVKRKVVYNQVFPKDLKEKKPKNLIIKWESPQLVVKKELKYLGVTKTNPDEYVKKYGHNLNSPSELPNFVHEIKAPDDITLAADHEPKIELYGDVEALKLIDLDKENLSEFKGYVKNVEVLNTEKDTSKEKSTEQNANLLETINIIEKLYNTLKIDENGRVRVKEAKKLIEKFKNRLGYVSGDVFKNKEQDSFINKDDFIKAFLNFILI